MIARTFQTADRADGAAQALRCAATVLRSSIASTLSVPVPPTWCAQPAGGCTTGCGPAGRSTVLLPQHSDTRPLQILGVHAADLDSQIPPTSTGCAARGLAVSADMFASDVRIRQEVLKALDRWMTEVTLWHDGWPSGRRAPDDDGAARAQRRRTCIQAPCPHRGRHFGSGRPHRDTAQRHESLLTSRFRTDPGRLMRKYHSHTLLYLHETIALGSGSSRPFHRGIRRHLPAR